MNTSGRMTRGAMMLAASAAGLGATGAAAQTAPGVTVRCCGCIDGSQQSVSLNTGAAPWQVSAIQNSTATMVPVTTPQANPNWAAMAPAAWARPPLQHPGVYTYQLNVVIPACAIPANTVLEGDVRADNRAEIGWETGAPIASTPTAPPGVQGYQSAGTFHFVITNPPPGAHKLTVRVTNDPGSQNSDTETGMILRGTLTSACPSDPEIHVRAGQGRG